MAHDQSRRLKPSVFRLDDSGYKELLFMTAYAPANPAFSKTTVMEARHDVTRLRRVEADAIAALAVARLEAIAKEWEFHNLMLGVKEQVIAQFGLDSDELSSLGRKKKSEYKLPGRKSTKR